MSRYVIGDHHFGHSNIIEYCDRPFENVAEMETTLLNRHYETVDADDLLIHLGDVAMDMQTGDTTIEYFERLNGDLLLRGNHDTGLNPDHAPFPVLDACILEQGDYSFYCTHRPEDVPDQWEQWVLHGHHHNNHPDTYPFVAYDDRRINVSAELLAYQPITLDTVTKVLDACEPGTRLRDVDAAKQYVQTVRDDH